MNSPNTSAELAESTVDATCATHGPYLAKVFPAPFDGMKPFRLGCQKCADEARAKSDRLRAEQEARERTERIAGIFRRSGVPARFADRTLANYAVSTDGQRLALRTATRFSESLIANPERGVSLVMCGRPGTGKTHLACAIARELANALRSSLFMTVIAAVRHVKETYRRDSERSEREAIGDLIEPDLLILDEIGVQVGSEHEKMVLFEIINERYQHCRSTILISNLNRDELTDYLGDRVMDRFREAGGVVAFDWPSHRGRQAA